MHRRSSVICGLSLCFLLLACERKAKQQLDHANRLASEKPAAALEQYAKAEGLGADAVAVKKGQAAALEKLGRHEEAEKLLREVLQLRPNDLDVLVALGRLAMHQGHLDEARSFLEQALKIRPPHVPSFLLFAALADTDVQAKRGQDVAAALSDGAYKKFRKSAEYVAAELALKLAQGEAAAAVLGELSAHAGARPFNGQLALAFASALQLGHKDVVAEWLLLRASEDPSAPEEVHRELAELGLRLHHPTVAEAAVSRLSRGFKRDTETLLLEAQVLELKSESEGEARATAGALASIPQGDERKKLGLTVVHARSLIKSGQDQEAEVLLERLLKTHPGYAPARLVLAAVRIRGSQFEQARAALGPLPQDPTFGVQASALVVRSYLGEKKGPMAVQAARECRAAHPKSASAFFLLVETQLALADEKGALETLEDASNVELEKAFVRARLVRLTADVRGKPSGEELARRLLKEKPDAEVKVELARILADQEKFAEAEQVYLELVAEEPQRWAGLSSLQYQQGKVKEAAESMVRLVDALPYDTAGWLRLGLLRSELGEQAAAASAYERLLQLEPNAPVALNNLALLRLEDPSRRAEAVQLARRAKAAAPENPAVLDTLGWALVLAGRDPAEARDLLVRSSQLLGTPESEYHYGAALLALGSTREAMERLNVALQGEAAQRGAGQTAPWTADAQRRLAEAKKVVGGSATP